jgi:hypothetical protein
MQITVTINPFYKKDIAETYPKLARALGYLDKDLVTHDPSPYELVGKLDKLLYHFDGTRLRDVLIRYEDRLRSLYKAIQKDLSEWNLSRVDKQLYSIEDIFDEIEMDLD